MCSKSDTEPPNEKPRERMRDEANYQSQNNGMNSQQQRRIAPAMNIPQNAVLVSLRDCLNKNNNTLFELSRDTTDRSRFGDDADKIFSFDAIAEFFKNNLRLEKQSEKQIEQISNLIMNPYRLSYELMGQKKYLICNIQQLLEILQDLFYNRNQAQSLEYLKNHYHRLTLKYKDIMILVQKDNLIKLKIQHIKEPDRQYLNNQKPIQIISKFSLKHQKLESIDMIVRSGSQQRIENLQQNEQVTQLNIVIIGLQKQVQSFKQIISNKVVQQNRMKEQISFLKNRIQNYETQIQNKDQQIRSAKKQMINSLTSQNQKLNNSIVEVTRQKQQLQTKVKGLVQTLKILEAQIKLMKQSNSTLSHQNQDLFQKQRKIKDQITMLEAQKRHLQDQKNTFESEKRALQDQRKRVEDAKQALQIEKGTIEAQKRHIQDQKNKYESEKSTLFEERTRIQNQIHRLQELQKEQKADSHKMQARLIQLAKQRDQMKMNLSNLLNELELSKLFTGDILQTQAKQKAFLVESIEKHMNKKIEKAKILYDTKRNYNVNYHERIDGKQNLVLILQTKNAIIAGYYSGKYAENTYMTSEGLILSLNNQKYYRLNNFANNPKKNKNDTKPVYGMIYDKFFLIFGNAQIRVKPGEKDRKVFSNFGINNSYFNSQGDNVSHLLCDGKKNDVQFIDYQIYQVIFSSKQEQAKLLSNLPQQTTRFKLQNEKIQQVYQTANYKTIAKNLEEESIRKASHIQQLNKQIEKLRNTKEELRFQNGKLSFNIDATQKQLSCLQSQVISLNQKLRNKEDQFSVMKQQIEGYERLSAEVGQQYNRISSQLDNIKLLNTEYSLDNSQLRSKIISLQMQLNEAKKNQQILKQQQPQISQSIVSIQKSEQISIIGSLSQISLAENSIIKDKLESALTTCESYRIQKQNKTKQIQHLKVKLSTQKDFIEQKCQEIQQLIRMKCSLQEQRDSLLIKSKEKGVENPDYKVIKSMQQQIKELKQTNEQLQQKLSYYLQKQSKMRTQSFVQLISHFNGELLQTRKDQKRFLIESIQIHMKKSIEKTRILYESIKDSKINFHDRLNGKSDLVIVLQTQKALLAGYYSGIYANKITMNEEGLILSLTNRKSYRLNNFTNYPKKNKNDKKVMLGMIYDDFYLIFGNAEIRVKPGQNNPKVFSNFAVSNSYFNNEGDNVNILLCEGKKNEVPLIRYEIYELIFFNMPFELPTQ